MNLQQTGNWVKRNLGLGDLVFPLFLFVILGSCSEEPVPGTPIDKPVPEIVDFEPKVGFPGVKVTVKGKNFSNVASENHVNFNGVEASLISSDTSELVVIVPVGATTGPLGITVGDVKLTGPVFKNYNLTLVIAYRDSNNMGFLKAWRNGVITTLNNGTTISSYNNAVINGEDIYVSGSIYSTTLVAHYWKNNEAITLSAGINSLATDIEVNDGNIYVCGIEHNGSGYKAKYWKNGIGIDLTGAEFEDNDSALTITVSNGDVYVGGSENISEDKLMSTYWKNGIPIRLTEESVVIYDMTVINNDVHILSQRFFPNTYSKAAITYWKNGVETFITEGVGYDAANEMIVADNGDVYIGGYETENGVQVPKLWKNGTLLRTFTDGNSSGSVGEIVLSDDILVAGSITINGQNKIYIAINDDIHFLNPSVTNGSNGGVLGMAVNKF